MKNDVKYEHPTFKGIPVAYVPNLSEATSGYLKAHLSGGDWKAYVTKYPEEGQMGRKSRNKGKVGEREACHAVRQYWDCPGCVRTAQVTGKQSADLWNGPDGVHLEVKRYAGIAALRFLRQAEEDANGDDVPMVLMRPDGDTEWTVMVRLKDFTTAAERINRRPEPPAASGDAVQSE